MNEWGNYNFHRVKNCSVLLCYLCLCSMFIVLKYKSALNCNWDVGMKVEGIFLEGGRDSNKRRLVSYTHLMFDWFYKNWFIIITVSCKVSWAKWAKRKGLASRRSHARSPGGQKVEKTLLDAWWLNKKLRRHCMEDFGQLQFVRCCCWWETTDTGLFWEMQFGVSWLRATNSSLVRNSSGLFKAWRPKPWPLLHVESTGGGGDKTP